MLPQLRSYLLNNWLKLPMDAPQPRGLDFLIQATGVSKLCVFIFADGESEPRWVAKMPRSPRDNSLLAHEYGLIRHLRDNGSEYIRETVPGPLFTTTIAEHLVGIETYYKGRPMDGVLVGVNDDTGPQVRQCLDMAVEWLVKAQMEAPRQMGKLSEQAVHTYLLEPIAQLQEQAQLTGDERRFLDKLAHRVTQLSKDYPLPLVFNHGDFRPGNILVDGNQISVIDFEFGAKTALPLMDVFDLLSRTYSRCHALEEIDGYLDEYVAAMEEVFFSGGGYASLSKHYVGYGCEKLDIASEWTSALFAMFLVTEAIKYQAFLTRRANQGYVYLMGDRDGRTSRSFTDQLTRQKNVWLLGHLANNESKLAFDVPLNHSLINTGRMLEEVARR